MEETIQYLSKSLSVLQTLSPELCIAEDSKSHLKYTVKYLAEPSFQRQASLKHEQRLYKAANLSHPNLLYLISSSESQSSIVFLYEYCNFGLLSVPAKIPALKVIYQLCLGLHYLHSRSFLHNSLTISNLFLHEETLKIAGLEYASIEKALIDRDGLENNEEIDKNYLEWKAPESVPSKESDVWGVGMILFYLLFGKVYQGHLPEKIPQHCKDLFLMTLNENPAKRASIQVIFNKLNENAIGEPRNPIGCACFRSRGTFSSKNSTLCIVKKISTFGLQDLQDENLKKLLTKVWKKPGKIKKFFLEMLRLQNLDNEIVRIKVYELLFLYIQQAPVLAYNARPGVLDLLNRVEWYSTESSYFERKQGLSRLRHLFSIVIKLKFYLVKSYLPWFNGKFAVNAEAKSAMEEPQICLVADLISYWEVLLKFQESLSAKNTNEHLCRLIRVFIAEEQTFLIPFTKEALGQCGPLPEFPLFSKCFSENLSKTKNLFAADSLDFPLIDENQSEILNNSSIDINLNSLSFLKRSLIQLPEDLKFSSVNLDSEVDPGTIYITAKRLKKSASDESLNASFDFSESLQSWQINSKDIELVKPLGSGSSSEVWLGKYQHTLVAVKRQKYKDHGKNLEFRREIALLSALRHPNLVTFMGICVDPPLSIVTEYCGGGDLFKLLHKKLTIFISWGQKLQILQEIAKGMIFLHYKKFIHRDLKSLNILLGKEPSDPNERLQVKIADFGLSRQISENEFMSGQIGTCHWMAPEVLQASKYNLKADVYSFGILMYEVIARQLPYKGLKNEDIRRKVISEQFRPDVESICPGCPRRLKALMVACWNANCDKRPGFTAILDILSSISAPIH